MKQSVQEHKTLVRIKVKNQSPDSHLRGTWRLMLVGKWGQSLAQDLQLLTVLTTLAGPAVQQAPHLARWARAHPLLDLDPERQSWVSPCRLGAKRPRAPWLVGVSGTRQT